MPVRRRQEILAWAKEEKNRYIIEDDYDSEFRFAAHPMPTMQSLDRAERVIYMNTFSKTISPSLRVGYMVLPKHLVPVYKEKLGFYSCTVPVFEQYVLAELINSGDFERHINRVRRERRKKK